MSAPRLTLGDKALLVAAGAFLAGSLAYGCWREQIIWGCRPAPFKAAVVPCSTDADCAERNPSLPDR